MQDFRCHNCNHKLYEAEGDVEVEVICPKCRRINYPSNEDKCLGFRGKDFQARSLTHVCVNCLSLLYRSIGEGILLTKCYKCKCMNESNTKLMRSSDYKPPYTEKGKKLKKLLAK